MTYRKTMSEAIREVQEATIKPYVSISSGGQYNVLDKDSKVVFSTRDGKAANAYLKKNYDKLKKEEIQETPEGFALVSKAKEIAKKMSGDMNGAIKEIEKLEKGLSNNSSVKDALQKANEEVNESASQVQVRRDGKGNFNLMFRGKEIGYYHKSGSKYMVYYDKDGDDYDQSDEVSSEMQAKKLAYDNMNEARFEVEGRVDYKGVSGGDDFSIVIDASNEKAAEDKVSDMLFKHRDQRKIGPRGGRGVDDYEIESVTRTSKSVTNKFSTYHAAEYKVEAKVDELTKAQEKLPPALQKAIKAKEDQKEDLGKEDDSIVKAVVGQLKKAVKAHSGQAKDLEKAMKTEADQHGDEINDKKHDAVKKGEKEPKKIADSGSKLTKVETEPKVDYKN